MVRRRPLGGIDHIFVGNVDPSASWNWNTLILGKYPNRNEVLDPDFNNQLVGVWTPAGTAQKAGRGMLDHIHIERSAYP